MLWKDTFSLKGVCWEPTNEGSLALQSRRRSARRRVGPRPVHVGLQGGGLPQEGVVRPHISRQYEQSGRPFRAEQATAGGLEGLPVLTSQSALRLSITTFR